VQKTADKERESEYIALRAGRSLQTHLAGRGWNSTRTNNFCFGMLDDALKNPDDSRPLEEESFDVVAEDREAGILHGLSTHVRSFASCSWRSVDERGRRWSRMAGVPSARMSNSPKLSTRKRAKRALSLSIARIRAQKPSKELSIRDLQAGRVIGDTDTIRKFLRF
jgi:hypothetical protein